MGQNEPIKYKQRVTYKQMLDHELSPEEYVAELRLEAERVAKAEIERWKDRLEEQRRKRSLTRRLTKLGSSIIHSRKSVNT